PVITAAIDDAAPLTGTLSNKSVYERQYPHSGGQPLMRPTFLSPIHRLSPPLSMMPLPSPAR
ncbi:hypothetical protein V5H41_28775, partial [Salmonella enterica]